MKHVVSFFLAAFCISFLFACDSGPSPKEVVSAYETAVSQNDAKKADEFLSKQLKPNARNVFSAVQSGQKIYREQGSKGSELAEEKHKKHAAVSDRHPLADGLVLLQNFYLVKEDGGWKIFDYKTDYAKPKK